MNDRELLEMAANAAGYRYAWLETAGYPEISQLRIVSKDWEGPYWECMDWNPLTDDGDVLRLAVSIPALNLQWIIAEAWQAHSDHAGRMAYVRRAIVRAAAAIGSAM